MKKFKTKTYDESSIKVLKGPDKIRKNPGMYVSGANETGLFIIFKEILDNAIDETRISKAKNIYVDIQSDFTITVADCGRGIPVKPHKDFPGVSTLTIIFTELHAGGKFDAADGATVGCFVGNTKIKLLDGTSVRIDELQRRWKENKEKFWIYAYDKNIKSAFVPRECYGVFATKLVDQLAEVTLDNGKKVRCTVDHPFMTWDGEYVEAQNLKRGQSLRAVHFAYDKDGYETHSGHAKFFTAKQHKYRTQRTVAAAMGMEIENKEVAHLNAVKTDNRPNNLEPMKVKKHWWHDHKHHGKNSTWTHKTKEDLERSSENMTRLNESDPKINKKAFKGKIVQVAARALRDCGKVSKETYEQSRPWGTSKWDNVVSSQRDAQRLVIEAKLYLKKYGKNGKTNNGGLGLNFQRLTDYPEGHGPSRNCNNHKIVSVRIFKTKKPVQVYGMSVDENHNYLLDAGVFVKNTHGVGATATNALSEYFSVYTQRDGAWHGQKFTRGVPDEKVKKIGKMPWRFKDASTVVSFRHDPQIFGKLKPDLKRIIQSVKVASYFNKGVTFHLSYSNGKLPVVEKYLSKKGIVDYLDQVTLEKKLVPQGTTFSVETPELDVALSWTSLEDELTLSYVSASQTSMGGSHVDELNKIITEALKRVGGKKIEKIKPALLRSGLLGIINVRVKRPVFSSQTKEKLISPEAKAMVRTLLEPLVAYFKKNKEMVRGIVERAQAVGEAEAAFKLSKKAAAELRGPRGKKLLPKKLSVSTTRIAADRELFLVEGDSAGGTGKQARDRSYQEVLALRGKFTNPWKSSEDKVFANETVLSIFQSIGYQPDKPDPLANLRVGKILLLSDADDDGKHINSLLVTLLSKYTPQLFDRGMVYAVDAPLYRAHSNGVNVYARTLEEIRKMTKSKTKPTRFKGWGEASPQELSDIAFDPKKRKIIKLGPMPKASRDAIRSIIGEDVNARKELLGLGVQS